MAPKKKYTHFYRQSGFTFIELVITVAIVAVLAIGVLPLAELTVKREKEQNLRRALWEMRQAINAYKLAGEDGRIEVKAGRSGYPPSLEILVDGVDNIRDPKRSKIYFLRRIPRDPLFDNQDVLAADSWGLRSYDSDPHEPKEGDDVYDIYSRSPGIGFNGVPYREW